MIATFGGKVFTVSHTKIYTFKDLKYGAKLETEKTDVQGAKPSTTIKGQGLDSLSCVVILSGDLGVNPRQEIDDFRRILAAAKPDFFVLGGRPLGDNRWLLVDLQAPFEDINNAGQVGRSELTLTFEEYVRQGATATTDAAATGVPGAAAGITINNPYDYAVAAQNKSDLKRSTTGTLTE